MRILLALIAAALSVAAQSPAMRIANASRPGSDFQIGDRFEIVITGAANQPVSVRTTMQGLTDLGARDRLDRLERPMVGDGEVREG
jgi:hypothetical protein